MNLDKLTFGEIKELISLFDKDKKNITTNPMVGKRCIVRTYSAGVHIGDVKWINPENPMECFLENALRLWRWEGGGLSLSAIANNGVVKARLNKTGKVSLTNAIEYIETTEKAENTFLKFIEDDHG